MKVIRERLSRREALALLDKLGLKGDGWKLRRYREREAQNGDVIVDVRFRRVNGK